MSLFENLFPTSHKRILIAQEIFTILKSSSKHRHEMRAIMKEIAKKTGRCETTVQLVFFAMKKAGMVKYENKVYVISSEYINAINQEWTKILTEGVKING